MAAKPRRIDTRQPFLPSFYLLALKKYGMGNTAILLFLVAGLGACGAPTSDSVSPVSSVEALAPDAETHQTPAPTGDELRSPQETTIRIFSEEWVAVLEEQFPEASYPAMGRVRELYQQSHEDPTEANYRAAGDAKYAFGETLPSDGEGALRALEERVQMRVFARVNALVMQAVAKRWAMAFPVAEYPGMAAVTERSAAMEAGKPNTPARVERTYRDFMDSLNEAERQRANDIEAEVRDAWGMR